MVQMSTKHILKGVFTGRSVRGFLFGFLIFALCGCETGIESSGVPVASLENTTSQELSLITTAQGSSGTTSSILANKVCPWGSACNSDSDCMSADAEIFRSYSANVANQACYAPSLDGSVTNTDCINLAPDQKLHWVGDYWVFDTSATSSSIGAACDDPSASSVWISYTENRSLKFCSRKYTCGEALRRDILADRFSCGKTLITSAQLELIESFDAHVKSFGEVYSMQNNRMGILGNNQPSYMDALLDVYVATGNEKYLQRFVVLGNRILHHRDDNSGFTDYRGTSAATWSDGRYSSGGQFVSFLIEDGALINSLAHFAAIVKTNDCLKSVRDADYRRLEDIADNYLKAAGETVAFHFPNWHTGTLNGYTIGYFTWPTDAPYTAEIPGKPVAINYHSAIGSALAYLYKASGNSSYLTYAQLIGNFILTEMSYNYYEVEDAYTWPYHPQMPYWSGAGVTEYSFVDDLSHSTVTAEFARAMYEQGLGVFYATEMKRIAHAYSKLSYNSGSLSMNIDGTGPSAGSQSYQFARVAMLAPFDITIWSSAYEIAINRLNTNQPGLLGSAGALTGLARLIRYAPKKSP